MVSELFTCSLRRQFERMPIVYMGYMEGTQRAYKALVRRQEDRDAGVDLANCEGHEHCCWVPGGVVCVERWCCCDSQSNGSRWINSIYAPLTVEL